MDFTNRFIYYVGPVDPVREKLSDLPAPPHPRAWINSPVRCWQQTGLLGMVGKAERGPAAIEAIKDKRPST